jgi:hypothetical protein
MSSLSPDGCPHRARISARIHGAQFGCRSARQEGILLQSGQSPRLWSHALGVNCHGTLRLRLAHADALDVCASSFRWPQSSICLAPRDRGCVRADDGVPSVEPPDGGSKHPPPAIVSLSSRPSLRVARAARTAHCAYHSSDRRVPRDADARPVVSVPNPPTARSIRPLTASPQGATFHQLDPTQVVVSTAAVERAEATTPNGKPSPATK